MAIHSCETTHYENFPVASVLCPAHLRPAIGAIYRFARTADDIADEGDGCAESRIETLEYFAEDLQSIAQGQPPSTRWPGVFFPLAQAMGQFHLPLPLLMDLLSAFSQDVVKNRYENREELLDYCTRSANPVGRLLLHLYGISDPQSLAQSDAICSALQLANFWQDLSVDVPRNRLYVPLSDLTQHGLNDQSLSHHFDRQKTRALVKSLTTWTRTLMQEGVSLPHTVQSRAGWRIGLELKLVVQGGLRILDRIERMDYNTLSQRPKLGILDGLWMLWQSLCMRPQTLTPLRSKDAS